MRKFSEPGKQDSPLPIVAVTGFMAAGKSTVGRVLASILGWRFLDLDCEIERRSKLHIHEIFANHGESHFRQIEADALRSLLDRASAPTIIALGGGTLIEPQNADLLRSYGAQLVFLELAVEKLLRRCRAASELSGQNPRPLAADGEAFCALYAQRLPHYRKADLIVNTEGKTAEQVAHQIVAALHLADAGHRSP
ncbi:MAG: shikimate kinase [Candidatus Korobacteraceae bacterium]|jgi:shikimate kinase